METEIRLFANCKCRLSESPIWDDRQGVLYWRGLDGEVFRKKTFSNPNDFEVFPLKIGGIGSIVLTEGEEILLFGEGGRIWKWIPHQEPILYKDFGKDLFNDVLCDSHGRVYCGMLASNYFDSLKRGKYGSFWCWDQNEFTCLEDKIAPTPNGIRISPQGDRLYFAVTDADCIYVYDYDLETGALSNRRVFAEKCFPDGIAVDELGRVWVADCKPTGGVLCYDSTGKLLQKITFPVRRVISLAFGGANRKILFVTTANENQPIGQCDGGVFYIRTDYAGANEYRFPRIK